MFFDRQVLYLALLFASRNVLAVPLSLPTIDGLSVEQPAVDSSSAVQGTISQVAKNYLLQNGKSDPSNAILSAHLSEPTKSPTGGRASSIRVTSASATGRSSSTSAEVNDLRLSLAKPTHSSTGPGNVNFESPNAGGSQQDINMALIPEPDHIIVGRDASPVASSAGALGTLESFFNSLISEAVGASTAAASASASQAALTTSVSQASNDSPTPTTTNALSILFSALPSSIADPLRSEFNSVISAVAPADQSSTNTASSQTTATDSSTNTTPTNSPTNGRTHTRRPTRTRTGRPTTRPTKHHTTQTTTSPTSHHTSPTPVTTTATQTNSMSQDHSGPPNAQSIGAHPISNASIAGIVSGLGAGFVVAGLAAIYLFRRKSQGKPMWGGIGLGRGGSKRSTGSGPYPAVAWLYDPKISPPGTSGHSRSGSVADGAEERLIPEPRHGSVEMAGSEAPHLPPARPSSPLLAPHMPPARDRSPSPGRNRASSNASDTSPFLRPMNED